LAEGCFVSPRGSDIHGAVSSSLVGESARVQAKGTFVVTFRDEGPWGDLHVTAASPATGSLAPPMVSLGRMVSVIKIEAAQLIR
jgi:hypothetical protein